MVVTFFNRGLRMISRGLKLGPRGISGLSLRGISVSTEMTSGGVWTAAVAQASGGETIKNGGSSDGPRVGWKPSHRSRLSMVPSAPPRGQATTSPCTIVIRLCGEPETSVYVQCYFYFAELDAVRSYLHVREPSVRTTDRWLSRISPAKATQSFFK